MITIVNGVQRAQIVQIRLFVREAVMDIARRVSLEILIMWYKGRTCDTRCLFKRR